MNQIKTVQFHGQTISVLLHNNQPHVAMKPICENIGLDWAAQYQKIKRNAVLNSRIVMTTIRGEDGKPRENLCLPLGFLNGWLFGVDANRVKPEIRKRLLQYQAECFEVLNAHFNRPIQQPRIQPPSVAEQLPTRNEILQVIEMLLDRLREINNWGGIEADRHLSKHFGKAPNAATYAELVKMVRWLHRQTQDIGGRPILAGHRYPETQVRPITADLMRNATQSEIMQAVAVHLMPRTANANRRGHAESALFEIANLHEVLLKTLHNKRYNNENKNINDRQIEQALMEAGRLHIFISDLITD
ncbi:phage antirepressor N-terminal domain-containing protein [Neisseria musculi]|uniref:P22-AR N-terminal domain protein n=1 Tax=Neisseria musculi TaxID=1815583 RepID=A0A7H1M9C7_9NEIS|nr:phage antirepressor N-terminal domain-containing protein [Neisseria musculi]QNT58242.1 antirepressor domain protein [Neisseria musculi]